LFHKITIRPRKVCALCHVFRPRRCFNTSLGSQGGAVRNLIAIRRAK
jgi:hypothetical protein